MQYIDVNNPKVVSAKDIHYNFLRYIIKKKINGSHFTETPPIPNMNRINQVSGIKSSIRNFLNNEDNLKKVLIGKPNELNLIKSKFTTTGLKKSIKKLLNYDSWIDYSNNSTYRYYNAYHLAKNLDIPTCVYCNRIYTKTVISASGKKITRPTFDHWFPKSKYPLLSLSFYNLIPSCSVCNSSVKGSIPFDLTTHFHPYYINPNEDFNYTFSYEYVDYNKYRFKIKTVKNDTFSKRSINAFELEEIYKTHIDEIEDLKKIKEAYSENYLNILESNILGMSLDRDEVYRLAFGVHYQEANFDKRPLSKMKKDILTELGII